MPRTHAPVEHSLAHAHAFPAASLTAGPGPLHAPPSPASPTSPPSRWGPSLPLLAEPSPPLAPVSPTPSRPSPGVTWSTDSTEQPVALVIRKRAPVAAAAQKNPSLQF